MLTDEWKVLVQFVQTFAVPLFGYGTYLLRKILSELEGISTRMVKLETRQDAHERIDDERFEMLWKQQKVGNGSPTYPGQRR